MSSLAWGVLEVIQHHQMAFKAMFCRRQMETRLKRVSHLIYGKEAYNATNAAKIIDHVMERAVKLALLVIGARQAALSSTDLSVASIAIRTTPQSPS
jgi:hypothetical protein